MFIDMPPTGTPSIDLLQQAQLIADTMPTTKFKIEKMTETVGFVGKTLLTRQLFCSARNFFGFTANEKELLCFEDEMMFMAQLDNFGYLADPSVPIDSLVLAFEKPEFLGIEPEHAPALRRLSLRVPVLAVDTCTVVTE
jgi:hypothetical protein